jgi:hypothetical protein
MQIRPGANPGSVFYIDRSAMDSHPLSIDYKRLAPSYRWDIQLYTRWSDPHYLCAARPVQRRHSLHLPICHWHKGPVECGHGGNPKLFALIYIQVD